MTVAARRRYIFRDADVERQWVAKVGTATARVFLVLAEAPVNVEYMQVLTLLAAAHHQDLLAVSGQPTAVTYPEDVADLVGYSPTRASNLMNELKRLGFLAGSHQAGYRLTSRLAAPRGFDEDH